MNAREILSSQFAVNYTEPVLLLDPAVVQQKIELFRKSLPRVEINYAIKANPHPAILRAVLNAGGSFDVASLQEAADALNLGADGTKIVYSNPIRPVRYLEQCSSLGISWYVVDNMHELIKVAKHVELPQIYIRLAVPNDLAAYPLAGKFGATLKEAEQIVNYCAEHGIALRGVSFHPGSQNLSGKAWVPGIRMAKQLFHYMQYKGIEPDFLNLGGGFPAQYLDKIETFEEYCAPINEELADIPDHFRIIAEPGRYICGEAMHLLCQVISTTVRDGQLWAYLDAGIFHALFEPCTIDGFGYHTETVSTRSRVSFTIAGPTCDSMDIISKNSFLPHDLVEGDLIVFQNTGAYSDTYATDFNGFPRPKVVVLLRNNDDTQG